MASETKNKTSTDDYGVTIYRRDAGDDADGVNFEGESDDALAAFALAVFDDPALAARTIFPSRTLDETRRVVTDLARIAASIVVAHSSRRAGRIERAAHLEAVVDRCLAGLPEWARW